MSERREQCELMLSLLRERSMFSHELERAGVGRPNSRAAQLRKRGFVIACEHRREGYLYTLVACPEDAPAETGALTTGAPRVPTRSDSTSSSLGTAPVIPGGAIDEQAEPAETAAAGSATAVEHAPTCATRFVSQAACDCLAGIALEETPAAGAGGVSSSASTRPGAQRQGEVEPVDGRPEPGHVEALDLDEQLRLEQDYEVLRSFGGDA